MKCIKYDELSLEAARHGDYVTGRAPQIPTMIYNASRRHYEFTEKIQ